MECEIVQSLAKWKRLMLHRLNCKVGEGIYCDSTSIRKGYKGDVTHSVVVCTFVVLFMVVVCFIYSLSTSNTFLYQNRRINGILKFALQKKCVIDNNSRHLSQHFGR